MIYYIYFESLEHEFHVELDAKNETQAIEEAKDWIESGTHTEEIDALCVMESAAGDIDDVDPYMDRVVKEYYGVTED